MFQTNVLLCWVKNTVYSQVMPPHSYIIWTKLLQAASASCDWIAFSMSVNFSCTEKQHDNGFDTFVDCNSMKSDCGTDYRQSAVKLRCFLCAKKQRIKRENEIELNNSITSLNPPFVDIPTYMYIPLCVSNYLIQHKYVGTIEHK